MKYLLLTILSSCAFSTAQAAPVVSDIVDAVREKYAQINQQQAKYRKVEKTLEGFSLEGGELIGYLNGKAIMKIQVKHYGESGRHEQALYFQDGKLIFVFNLIFQYTDTSGAGKVASSQEERLYFDDGGHMARYLLKAGKSREIKPETAEFKAAEKSALEDAVCWQRAVRSTGKTFTDKD